MALLRLQPRAPRSCLKDDDRHTGGRGTRLPVPQGPQAVTRAVASTVHTLQELRARAQYWRVGILPGPAYSRDRNQAGRTGIAGLTLREHAGSALSAQGQACSVKYRSSRQRTGGLSVSPPGNLSNRRRSAGHVGPCGILRALSISRCCSPCCPRPAPTFARPSNCR